MKKKKGILLCVIFSGICLFVIGCSSSGFLTRLWNSDSPTDKEMARFASTVRPYRGNPDSHYLLGLYYQERGRHKEAITEFKKAVFINPRHINAYNALGVSYDSLKDFPKAIEAYKKALELNPNLDYVHNNIGYSYLVSGNYDAAVDAFQKAIALNDKVKRYHNNLALAHARKGRFEQAFNEFKQSDDEAKAHYNTAMLYYEKGLYKEAKAHFNKALSIDPSLSAAKVWQDAAETRAKVSHPLAEETVTEKLMSTEKQFPAVIEKMIPAVHQENPAEQSKPEISNSAPMVSHPAEIATAKTTEKSDTNTPAETENKSVITEKQKEITPLTSSPIPAVSQPAKNIFRGKEAVEVSNGNGVNRMAKKMGNYLKGNGFKVVRLTNANNFKHARTLIYYQKGHFDTAYGIARKIPGTQHIKEARKFDRKNIDIKVLIGKDIVPFHTRLARTYQ